MLNYPVIKHFVNCCCSCAHCAIEKMNLLSILLHAIKLF